MITTIKIKKDALKTHELSVSDFYNQYNCKQFPFSVALSFQNFSQVITAKDVLKPINIFANEVTNACFHFLAIIAFCDYLHSKREKTPQMYAAIESMLNKPGPGVWLGFLRTYYHFCNESGWESKFPELISFIERHEINKNKNPSVEVSRNYNNETTQKMGLLEFLVAFRNNMAHSKGYDEETAKALIAPLTELVAQLAMELSFLSSFKLTLIDNDQSTLVDQESFKSIGVRTNQELHLVTQSETISLFPMAVVESPAPQSPPDVFLLESIKKKNVIFSAQSGKIIKNAGQDNFASSIFKLLEEIYVEPWLIEENKITWMKLRERSEKLTETILKEKHTSPREHSNEKHLLTDSLLQSVKKSFLNSGKRVLFLSSFHKERQEIQKFSSITSAWELDNERDILIPIIPDIICKYSTADTPFSYENIVCRAMGISGDLKNVIRNISNQKPDTRVIFIFDGLEQTSVEQNPITIKHLFDFIYRIKDFGNLIFVVNAEKDNYLSGFNKYMQVFKDKIEDITYIKDQKIVVSLFEEQKEKRGLLRKIKNKFFDISKK